MRLRRLRSWLLASCAAGVLAIVGCGQGNPLYSPTAPTGTLGSTALTTDEAPAPAATASSAPDEIALGLGGRGSDNGHGNGKDKGDKERGKNDKGKGGDSAESDDDDDDESDRPGHGHRGMLSGFVTAKGTNTLTVRGITVEVTNTTRIRHGNRILTFADIHVGDHVQARGTMDGTTLVATEVKVEDTGNDNDDDGAKVEGVVSGFSATGCPAVTFMVGTTKVTTTASTVFENVTCATLANDMTVEVKGTRQTDGSVLVTKVERERDEVQGSVSGLTGSCATGLTFMVGTTKVTTSNSTTFSGGTCAAIMNLTKVKVEGTKGTDGTIAALKVKLDLDEVEGTISGLTGTGTCPSLTFMIGPTRVTTSNTTTFTGVTCAALANGTKVEVEGTRLADLSIAAATVELD